MNQQNIRINFEDKPLPANILLDKDVLKTFSRCLEDIFSVTIFRDQRHLGRREIVTLHYYKNGKSFRDLLKLMLCSASL